MYKFTELPKSEWLPQYSHDGKTEPWSWITGYSDDELRIPMFKMAQWYQEKMNNITDSPYRGPSYTAEELDERCNAAARANRYLRQTDF
ncbi:hypothetical protein OIT41_13780 [Arthrobacter sp. YA7-1]|uniref:hypothetical protein n=1 Tax=Arthrobacter sp. YA7-1 TaxID=2987701 RepID=UPI002226D6BF|nr:hypothetical protein [Arthrobacter sp. YA7-1]UYY80392.1 hypothetical protein OIT41_13780 [Arthrobacter sp. YA7-1]